MPFLRFSIENKTYDGDEYCKVEKNPVEMRESGIIAPGGAFPDGKMFM
jgi:hypothetical protein